MFKRVKDESFRVLSVDRLSFFLYNCHVFLVE